MKKTAFALSFLIPIAASAQTVPPASDPLQDVSTEWTNMAASIQSVQGSQKHILDALQKLAQSDQALKDENAKLKTEIDGMKSPASTGTDNPK